MILDGADPGLNFDETEGDLDTEWSGAIAPGATIDFVIAEDTEASSGIDLAAEHIVDNNLAPVLSESFGECEAFLGSGSEFYGELWEQAAAQGITVIISAGDSGSAGCDNENAQATAGLGLNVNAIASTPFNVAAGGTDFDYTAYSTNAQTGANQYWNAPTGNNSTTEASAKGYIPETTWNDSCAQSFSTLTCAAAGSTSSSLNIVGGGGGQSNCINPTSQLANGQIVCGAVPGFMVSGVNYNGWPKPSWQPVAGSGSGLTAATDVLRDLPDISLFASDGQTSASFYIVCEQDLDKNDAACSLSNLTTFIGVGGTSSSAPTFAGIMALVNQKTATLTPAITGQGNANYVLYPLYNAQVTANTSCSSSSSPNSLCTFNDVTKGDNSVPCMVGALVGSANCSVSSSGTGDLVFGTTTAWNAVTGFDLATGLGSVNATNLINNWATQVGTFTPTETTLCLVAGSTNSPACSPLPTTLSITHGGVVSGSVTVKNTSNLVLTSLTSTLKQPEDATLLGVVNGTAIPVDRLDSQNADIYPLAAGTITGPLTAELVGGTYAVHAHYAGDGKNGSSDSNVINVTVSPEPSETAVSALLYNFLDASGGESAAFSISSGASVYYGDSILLRTDVFGANSGEENGSGSVTLTDTTTSTILGTYTLNSDGYAENQTGSTVDGLITPPLAVGTHTIQATYTGDASYCPSPTVGGCGTGTSTAFGATFNVASAPTTTTLTASATGVTPGSSITVSSGTNVAVTAFVDTFNTSVLSSGGSSGAFLTGTVTFSVTPSGGATTQTPVNITSSSATFDSDYFVAGVATLNLPTVTATTTVTATFTPGNTNYVTSASTTNATVNVGPTFTISPSTGGGVSDTINISAPGQSGSLPITVNSSGFSGNVTLTCAVAPSNLTDTPGCSFTLSGTANNTVALTGSGSNGQRQLNITTTAASSLPGLLRSPQGLNGSPLPVVTVSLLVFLLFSLSWGMSVRKRRGVALLATLLLVVVAGTISCGGGGSSGGTGTGGGGNSGTTVATYSVTVTATPATGTAQQTTVVLNVN